MGQIEPSSDFYAILGVTNKATLDEIKKSYRSRARDIHPDKNPGNANATAEFQRLGDAYGTLKDPQKRRDYDTIWPGINAKERAEHDAKKRREEAAEASRRQAAQQAARIKKENEVMQLRLDRLRAERNRYQDDIFEGNRRVRRLTSELACLQALDDEELRREKAKNSWWTYLSTPIYGKAQEETADEKQAREVERLQRVASKSIKKNELDKEEKRLQNWNEFLNSTTAKIEAEYKRRDSEAAQAAAKKKAEFEKQQADARQAELERRWAEIRKRQQEAERVAKEQQAKREKEEAARVAAERQRQADFTRIFEEQMKKEQDERERQARARTKFESFDSVHNFPSTSTSTTTSTNSCQHRKFWPKVDGGQTCSNCCQYQPLFVFQCPDCKMRACAHCRQNLRGERRSATGARQRTGAGAGAHKSRKEARAYGDNHCENFYDDYY